MNNTNSFFEKKAGFLLPAFCALFASVTFFLYAPCAIYFSNAEEFLFTFYNFRFVPLLCFLIVSVLLFIPGALMKKGKTVYCAFLFSVGLLVYVQGNFLFEDAGVFNGMPYLFINHRERIIQNCAVWILGMIVCIAAALRFQNSADRVLTYLSGFFTAFVLVSLLFVFAGADKSYLRPRESFVSTEGLLELGSEKNTVIFVPDMFDKTYMDTILEDYPESLADFHDFTYYSGIDGCYGSTKESLPAFLSDSVLTDQILKKGYSAGIYTDGRFIPADLRELTENCRNESGKIRDIPRFVGLLYRLVACSYAPDIFRPAVWLYGNEFDGVYTPSDSGEHVYTTSNTGFYDLLESEGLSENKKPCFRMIHLYGSHYPYVHDEYLNPINPSFSDENAVKASRGVLRILSAYLEHMKDMGVYDSSLIVIMADHGYVGPGMETDPLFLVKEPYASADKLTVDKTFFSQSELPAIIAKRMP